jgi:DNA-binding transcriptional MocR family regulator
VIPAVARWYSAVADFAPAEPRDTVKVRAIAFALGQSADWWTGRLCVSTTVLAERAGLGRNTVSRILAELDRAGYIVTQRKHGNGDAPQRCLTIRNRSAPVRLVHDSRGGNCTPVVQSKEAKEGSCNYVSTYGTKDRASARGNVVHLDARRGELGALIAETRANLRTAQERGPQVRPTESLEGTTT